MFSHRAPMLSSAHPSSQGRQLLVSKNNENAVVSSAKPSNTATTPAKSSMKRRAFGDISNKKQAPSSSSSKSNVVLKKTAFTPRSKLQHYQHQSSVLPKGSNNATRKPPSSFAPIAPKITTISNSFPQAVVPRKTTTTTTSNPAKKVVFEAVDNVELPAGRLFSQQLELDDDSASEISEAEFISTMWDDWRSSVRQQYEEEGLKIDQQVELEVQERMKTVFQQEEGKTLSTLITHICIGSLTHQSFLHSFIYRVVEDVNGIHSLLDWVDDLDLDQEDIVAGDDDADEWSQPASSFLGDSLLVDDSLIFES